MNTRSALHGPSRPRPLGVLTTLVAVVALLLGSSVAATASAGSIPIPAGTSGATSSSAAASTTSVRVYLLLSSRGSASYLVPVLRRVPATQAVAAAAVRELLKGPAWNESGLTSAIASGVKLLGITISGTSATVNLTGRFHSSGSAVTMRRRLAELTYTVTQFSNVQKVYLRLDGRPVSVFGGMSIRNGMSRGDFRGNLPPIFVDRPTWRGGLPSGSRVTGLANVFEAQFTLRLLDRNGRFLISRSVTATCGSGCWGTFGVTLVYHVATAQWGTLRVFDRSERDGSVIAMRDYPVWLTP